MFLSALAYNVARGLDIHCGCFSPGSGETVSMETIFRDTLILCLSFYLMYAVFCKKLYAKSNGNE
jgi:hypothetical protein